MSLVIVLVFCIVPTLTLVDGSGASLPTKLNQNHQNWTTFNHDEITTNLNLIHIDVSHNQITEFNSSVFSTHHFLEALILSYNELYTFPTNASFLLSNSLERFECVSCGISIIYKETFSELPKLKEVDLNNNHLSVILNGAFGGSFFLRNLNFNSNSLKKIPIDLLSRSAVNAKLTMNHNTDFDFEANEVFLKSKTLIEFQCNNCSIATVYDETFSESPNLESIYLNDNNISTIASKMFVKNLKITGLFLERNKLMDFPINDFNVILKLKALCIDGNPFTSSAINAMKNDYMKAKLRTNCTEKNSEKYFENETSNQDSITTPPSPENELPNLNTSSTFLPPSSDDVKPTKNKGISDAFIASYLLIILVAQTAVIGGLIVYWFKIVLTDKVDEFDYSSNILNDHDIYDVS